MTLTERPCAFPPHPDSAEPETIVVTESALSRFRGWLRHAPAERLPLPAVPAVWTAAEIMHAVGRVRHVPGGGHGRRGARRRLARRAQRQGPRPGPAARRRGRGRRPAR